MKRYADCFRKLSPTARTIPTAAMTIVLYSWQSASYLSLKPYEDSPPRQSIQLMVYVRLHSILKYIFQSRKEACTQSNAKQWFHAFPVV